MCSRFVLKSSSQAIANLFKVETALDWKPRYNVAPSQKIPVIIHPLEDKKRTLKLARWGFVASWTQGGRLLVNVQSESVDEKPLLRESFEKWRCLIPVDGFYEWRHAAHETRPYFFQMKKKQPFALAGLWAPQEVDGKTVESCTILTTNPNETVRAVHDRMPVIIDPADHGKWLDSEDVRDFRALKKLFKPYPANKMEAYQVGSWVNNAFHDDAKCMEASREPETLQLPF
jgi:putative SOS response-associated peptidase YedK